MSPRPLRTVAVVLIPVAIGINYAGKLVAAALRLPLWLDAIGTVLAAILAGPWVGALSGLLTNALYGITADPVSFFYGVVNLLIGFVAGFLARLGWFRRALLAAAAGTVIAVVAALSSTPINVSLFGGQTGNPWADGLFAFLLAQKVWLPLASFVGELATDLPDKVAVAVAAFAIVRGLPHRLTALLTPPKAQG
ncbi:MAG: ECF transporter S component [candidate division NC10 bacterium]|nr:ECF transporter S component [candidate division NC10 bacterium]